MALQNVAVGFLYHAASGKVLLLRDEDKPPSAGLWAFFGGLAEPEDGDSLLATWCREMQEELGVTLDPAQVRSLRNGADAEGRYWHDYYLWPTLSEDFVLTDGQGYAWFTLDEALALPILTSYARDDLILFRSRIAEATGVEAHP